MQNAPYSSLHDDPYSPPPDSKLKRRIIIGIAVIVLILAGVFGFRMFMMMKMGGGGGGFGGDFPTAVIAYPPRAEKADRIIAAVGNLRAENAITVAPEIAGRIDLIPGEEGTMAKKGDVLVTLDQQTVKAELQDAEASAVLTRANYERARSLASRDFGTERAKDEALAALRQAEARVALAKTRFEKTFLLAPFDGMLGLREKSIGAYVNPGEAILSLASIDPINVDFRVPELKAAGVRTGQKVAVTVDAIGGKVFEGEVSAIDALLDEAGHSLNVRARIANPEGALRAGMFARVTLSYAEPQDVLVVPERAVFLQGNDAYVYRAIDGKAVLTKVTLGERRVGEVEIVEGIAANEDIITDGQIKLRPDAKVMLLNKPNVPSEKRD